MFVEDTLILAYWDPAVRRPSSVRRRRSQVASLAAKVSAMYSASVEDSATVACYLERQLTALWLGAAIPTVIFQLDRRVPGPLLLIFNTM